MAPKQTELFKTVNVWKAVLTLAIPTIISQLITVIYNMADTFFIGQLNVPAQVAAAQISLPIFMFLTALANLFGIGGASLISRCLGAGNRERASNCSAFCFWAMLVCSFVYGIVILAFLSPVLNFVGAKADTLEYCRQYVFWTVCIGAVPTVLNAGLAHLIRSEGYAAQASIGVALGGVLNIALDPLFIFTFGLQIKGAAIATLISNCVATLFFLAFLWHIRKKSVLTLSPKFFTVKGGLPKEVVTVGLPSFTMTFMATLSNVVLNNIIEVYSTEATAGMGIAKKIDTVAFAIAQGMTQGTLPLIGYNYTSGNRKRMVGSFRVMLIYGLSLAVAGGLLLFVLAEPIALAFIADAETVRYGTQFLKIICVACPVTVVNFCIITLFQATGRKVQPLVLALLRKGGLDIPLMILLNRFVGLDGIAWAIPVSDFIGLMVAGILLVPYLKKLKQEIPLKRENVLDP